MRTLREVPPSRTQLPPCVEVEQDEEEFKPFGVMMDILCLLGIVFFFLCVAFQIGRLFP